jgi:chromosome segregation protein
VLENLAQQLSLLTRQAKQAARYRELSEELRVSEGMLLWRRWREADEARIGAEGSLRERLIAQGQAEALARASGAAREAAEEALPPKREEEAIAAAVLQRLVLQRDALGDQEARALATIQTLRGRIEQLSRDMEREAGLNRDAGEVIERLEWEVRELARAHDGHDEKLAEAVEAAREAGAVLGEREAMLSELTEDAARLAARHQSSQRMLSDTRTVLDRAEGEAIAAREAVASAAGALDAAGEAFASAEEAVEAAIAEGEATEAALEAAETARAETQGREAEARAARSSAEGEAMRCGPRWRRWRGWWSARRRRGISCWTGWRWSLGSRRRWARRWRMTCARPRLGRRRGRAGRCCRAMTIRRACRRGRSRWARG